MISDETNQGESSKDKETKTERRAFLKRAGIVTTGLCALGLPKLAAAKPEEPKEPDKSLNEEIAQLQPEEKTALTTLLKGLWEVDTTLTPGMVKCYLNITRAIVECQKMTAEKEKAEQEERKRRDGLTGQAKVDYVVEKLRTEDFGVYRASYQRELLKLVAKGESLPPDWKSTDDHTIYAIGRINETFEGCSKSFRRKVIDQYLTTVLPEMEAKHQKEDASQEAYDNLLSHLGNKTTAEINALTKQLKRAGTGKGVSI